MPTIDMLALIFHLKRYRSALPHSLEPDQVSTQLIIQRKRVNDSSAIYGATCSA